MEKDLFNHLHSQLLPLLEQQITYLSSLLDPTELKSQPRQMLGLILEIQPELGRTLDQIQMELKTNCLIRSTISISKNTKNLEKMVYTGPSNLPLQKSAVVLSRHINSLNYWNSRRQGVPSSGSKCLRSSHNLTKLKDSMGWIHYELGELLTLLKKYDDENENKGEDEDEDEDQVDQANVTSQDSKRVTASLKTCLQGYLLTVVLYFVLLIPQNINDHPYNQDYIRDWFTTWNNHFSIAICTLEGDAQSFDDHH
ncbi:hypothetical protein Pst134EA_023210 [Puccinia striiformis f. sp. tritici]|uniref:hypothetical protein n=1 Tax=Puccinia striiformis f. sp. tritici TaxID=168172 RepID=UPI002007C667|nr:hypothetical protein Pst134EA_023210 [Puccinia striiformis f. sp. tritici]KAH9455759.1 hypothetical protein Pst134EA_023210 [Puccinia striiformis f. sp. tritici]